MKPLNDLGLLVPAFRERLEAALKSLQGQGFHPHVHETLRSKERAARLVAEGKSKARGGMSMHCYGCACDVICSDHNWDCARNHCKFFETLGMCAEDVNLTWGGRWPGIVDLPHVQAVPAIPRLQDKIRTMAPEHVDTFLRTHFAGLAKS